MAAINDQHPVEAKAGAETGEEKQPLRFDANAAVGWIASNAVSDAASGDLAAQRFIRDEWSQGFHNPELPGPDSDLTDAVGMMFARLCAARGDRSDANMLAILLLNVGNRFLNRGRTAVGCECLAESLSLYERLGETGDANAAAIAQSLLNQLPAHVVARAKEHTMKGIEDGSGPPPICIRAYH